jgi:gliding motility-associated-like protein
MPAFEAEVKTQSVRCFGERNGQARLVNVGGGNGAPYRYSIDGQRLDTLGVFEGLAAGGYTMRIQDSKGCEWSRAAIVLQPAPIEVDLDKIVKIALGDSVQVFPRSVIRPEFKVKVTPNYNVDCDTCLNPSVKPYQKTTYTILVQDPLNGCFQRDSMTVWVENTAEIFVPNSFSPNQDGWNDYFIPFGGRKVKRILQMTVWARNGALLFKAHHINHSDETQGWDGKFNGQDMPIGTYMYLLEVEFWDESAKTFTGDINLFR